MVRTVPTRQPDAAVTDRAALDRLLDDTVVAHIGFVTDDHPLVLPIAIVRDGDQVLVHGSTGSRWLRHLATGGPVAVAVTAVDGLIIARSAFESSVRYRSAVLFGSFTALDGTAKATALDVVTEGLLPGRLQEVRPPLPHEYAATLVLTMPIETWSLKISDGWPEDGAADVAGPAWAGVVPMRTGYGPAQPAPDLAAGRPIPASVRAMCGEAVRS